MGTPGPQKVNRYGVEFKLAAAGYLNVRGLTGERKTVEDGGKSG